MKAHIVLAHPEPKSFNGQLSRVSERVLGAAGWQTTLSDLYAMDFDPREGPEHYRSRKNVEIFDPLAEQRFNAENDSLPPEVNAEIERLLACELLVIHFPIWWFGAPAIFKGWIDRVLVHGRMHRSTLRYDTGVCAGKKVIVCVTTGADKNTCSPSGKEGDTRLHLWPLLYSFRYVGFDVCEPEVLHGVAGAAFTQGHENGTSPLDANTKRWVATLEALSSRPRVRYNRDGDFDETERLVPGAPVYSPFIRHVPDDLPQ